MVFRYLFVITFLFSIISASAQQSMMANVDNVLLEKLINAAKKNYPKMKSAEIKVDIARLGVNHAKLDWFNIVSFTYLYSPNNSTTALVNPSLLNGYQFGFSTSVGGILQRPGAVKAARDEYKLAELTQEEYNLNIVAVVKKLYYAYVQQQTILDWRTKSLDGAESLLKDMKYKFEKGLETFENYNKAQAYYGTTIQSKIESEGAYLTAKGALEEIIGVKFESVR